MLQFIISIYYLEIVSDFGNLKHLTLVTKHMCNTTNHGTMMCK